MLKLTYKELTIEAITEQYPESPLFCPKRHRGTRNTRRRQEQSEWDLTEDVVFEKITLDRIVERGRCYDNNSRIPMLCEKKGDSRC
ncbi:MAG: hypothetical protein NTX75_01695 [Proteobacteria bacterium]|nr:hypothetical protein [Pseudomonadota bacterium]